MIPIMRYLVTHDYYGTKLEPPVELRLPPWIDMSKMGLTWIPLYEPVQETDS
jgi:hypothetical protein